MGFPVVVVTIIPYRGGQAMSNGQKTLKSPWGVLRPAPAPKRHPKLKAGKVRDAYDLCYMAWRAGAIEHFYFGEDALGSIHNVWEVDDRTWDGDLPSAPAEVAAYVKSRLDHYGIVSVAFGAAWCGYRELVVAFADGRVLAQRYTGSGLEVVEVAA